MRTMPALAALVAMLAITGCVQSDPIPTLPPTPTAQPVFESEEEALAAAEAAYVAYQHAVDSALQTLDPNGLETVAVGDALERAIESVVEFEQSGQRQEGFASVDSVAAADLSSLLVGDQDVAQIYACLDLSQTRVINADGSLDSSSQSRFPMLVDLIHIGSELRVQNEEIWTGASFC